MPTNKNPADVAKRIKEWLGPNGRENTASLLLYEAVQALERCASPAERSASVCAVDGAIAYGRMGVNRPPDGHWLTEYWSIGQQLAELGKTSAWDNQTPVESAPSVIEMNDAQLLSALDQEVATRNLRWVANSEGNPSIGTVSGFERHGVRDAIRALLVFMRRSPDHRAEAAAEPSGTAHPDDVAVDRFAAAMKEKLAQAREKGRGGWEQCDPVELSIMLREHVEKGDPRDVANFCMFLWSLGKPITDAALPYGKRVAPAPLHLGASLTDGTLHVVVMRHEDGASTVVATADLEIGALAKVDCHAVMKAEPVWDQRTPEDDLNATEGVLDAALCDMPDGFQTDYPTVAAYAHAIWQGYRGLLKNARASQSRPLDGEEFQARVQPWMMACFGPEIAADTQERNHRFLEEALELVQACGATASEAHQLVDYVYGRPVGDKHQEIGGVMVTLAALCLAQGQNMHAAGETELARIWTKVEQIRAKQAAKPKHSPLPERPRDEKAQPEAEKAERALKVLRDLSQWMAVGMGMWKDGPTGPYLGDIVTEARHVLSAHHAQLGQ
ncbi:hypothetical protein [Ralstonia sp. Ralssp135]|uniref:hypothetical protein n=1 Tax=Ralstonia sp. Ralssp135 TaxID=3243016 RepID=UPI0039AE9E62